MSPISLITSVPPRMTRSLEGREIGSEYLQRCISSWRACGLQPVSVNSSRESSRQAAWAGEVQIVETTNDAQREAKRPLVYFHDLLRAAVQASTGDVVAITNADVLLHDPSAIERLCRRVTPTRAVMARRIDVDNPARLRGDIYPCGFDFFAVHASQLVKVPDVRLVFGAPWWDYFLPIALLAQGVELELTTHPVAYHLRHDERWNMALWRAMGQRYVQGVRALLTSAQRSQRNAQIREYKRVFYGVRSVDLARVAGALRHPWRDRRNLQSGLGIGALGQHHKLTRLSLATIDFFDRALPRDRLS